MKSGLKYATAVLLAYFATSRLFTETLHLLPKWFDLLECILLPAYAAGIAIHLIRSRGSADWRGRRLPLLLLAAFAAAAIVSGIANAPYIHLPSALLYLWSFAVPPIAGVLVSLLRVEWERSVIRLFAALAILQVPAMAILQFPAFIAGKSSQDIIAGTFGLGGDQFAFFLVLCGGVVFTHLAERRRFPLLAGALLLWMALFILLSFRAAVPVFLVSLGVLFLPLRTVMGLDARRFAAAAGGAALAFIVCLWIGTRIFPVLQYDAYIFYAEQGRFLRTGKAAGYRQTAMLLAGHPSAALFGSGPGTMVSRGFMTFYAEPKFTAAGKGVGAYASRWEYPADKYHPRFREYIEPIFRRDTAVVEHAPGQLGMPAASVLSLVAETGFAGAVPIVSLYLFCALSALRRMQSEDRKRGGAFPLAGGLLVSSTFLFLIGVAGDYWEVSRMTFPLWISWGVLAAGAPRSVAASHVSRKTISLPSGEGETGRG